MPVSEPASPASSGSFARVGSSSSSPPPPYTPYRSNTPSVISSGISISNCAFFPSSEILIMVAMLFILVSPCTKASCSSSVCSHLSTMELFNCCSRPTLVVGPSLLSPGIVAVIESVRPVPSAGLLSLFSKTSSLLHAAKSSMIARVVNWINIFFILVLMIKCLNFNCLFAYFAYLVYHPQAVNSQL